MSLLDEHKFAVVFEEALGEVLGTVPAGVGLDTRFTELDVDSLSRMEIMAVLESKLDARIEDDLLQSIDSGRDLLHAFRSADGDDAS